MIVPFLFTITPATPPIQTAVPVVIAGSPAPQAFAGLLEQVCGPEPTSQPERSAGDDTTAHADSPALEDKAMESDVAWAAYILMPVVSLPPAMAAEALPTPEAASASPVVIPTTVEQAIATTVEPLGIDAADIKVEVLITDEETVAPTTLSASTDSTPLVQGDLSLLEPRTRARVERVITRARTELGLQVVVTETLRSQQRQDALFAQGRTEPGEVVTWTRRSLHTDGFAADLAIVGNATPAERQASYERLAKTANEEGLNTLGPRDPGHVEFRGGPALHQTVIPRRNDLKLVPLGKVAPVARPEVVAAPKPATAAPVARVATPSSQPESFDFERDDVPQHAPIPTHTLTPTPALPERQPVVTTNIAARIEEVHSIADAMADRPVTGVVLRLDGDAGDGDRIRIDVRRSVVETSVQSADPSLTHRLVSDAPVLRSALERQGLEVGRIEVRPQLVATADTQPRGFEGGREREPSSESSRRSQHHESRQRQRRNPNQNGESQR